MTYRYVLTIASSQIVVAIATSVACAAPVVSQDDERLVLDGWQHVDTANGLPDDYVRTVCPHKDGVWVGTNNGVALFDGRAWKSWSVGDGLAARVVTAIAVDNASQDAWIGTWGGGLARFSAGRFDTFNQFNSGLAGDLVLDVVVMGDVVAVSTNGGVSLFEPLRDRWTLSEHLSRSPPAMLSGIRSSNDELWVGAWSSVPRRFSLNSERDALSLTSQRAIVESRQLERQVPVVGFAASASTAWLLARSSLWHVKGTNLESPPHHQWQDGTGIFPTCVSQTQEGGAVVGTSNGLYVFSPSPADGYIIYRKSGGGAGEAVRMADGRELARRKISSPLAHNFVTCVASAGETVWVGTPRGLSRAEHRTSLRASLQTAASRSNSASLPTDREHKAATGSVKVSNQPCDAKATIGLVGPWTRTVRAKSAAAGESVSHHRPDLLAAQVAVESINTFIDAQIGCSIKLQTDHAHNARYGWTLPDDDFGVFAGRPDIVSVLADIPPGLAPKNAIAWKTQIPVMNTAPMATVAESSVDNPWVFRCWANRPRQMKAFMDHLIDELGLKRMVVVRASGRAARLHTAWWSQHARKRGLLVSDDYDIDSLDWQAIRQLEPDVVLSWSDASTSARILSEIRQAELDAVFVGSSDILLDTFLEGVGPNVGTVMTFVPMLQRISPTDRAYALQYATRNQRLGVEQPPGENAFRCRDAIRHVAFAIRTAGADRLAIRNVLSQMESSLVGEKHHELDHPARPLTIATLRLGEWIRQDITAARARSSHGR